MINAKLSGAARTLVLTLQARADEQKRDKRLVKDTWSANWYKLLPKYEDYEKWYNPAFQLATLIRTRLIDDAVKEFIEAHDKPLVVELGAGFSTRYYRLGEGKTEWVEVDLGEAIAVRRKLDVEHADHWFLETDITAENWYDRLPEYDPKNTLFIAEGALMFIEPEGIGDMFQDMRQRYSGASFVFDVVNQGYIDSIAETFQNLDAAMKWGG
ncbi:MAG: class I SAM-dependent methyltransferase [Anaerolineae bacterium]|nr:class I SAM-dependent methyltransferase [Anaerolineae bacterium]